MQTPAAIGSLERRVVPNVVTGTSTSRTGSAVAVVVSSTTSNVGAGFEFPRRGAGTLVRSSGTGARPALLKSWLQCSTERHARRGANG